MVHTYLVSSYGLDSQAFDLNLKLSSLMILFSSIFLLHPGYPILLTSYDYNSYCMTRFNCYNV